MGHGKLGQHQKEMQDRQRAKALGYVERTAPARDSGTYSDERQRQARSSGNDTVPGASQSNTALSQSGTVSVDSVRATNLKNLEESLNIIANGCGILGIMAGGLLCLGVPVGVFLVFRKGQRFIGALMIFIGPAICALTLATPQIINWSVGRMRDANLFS
jgi:hypothetical protein